MKNQQQKNCWIINNSAVQCHFVLMFDTLVHVASQEAAKL